MALRANVLAKGFSGIRVETLEALIALLNRRRASARAVARLGRRQRRPRAARAPRARADRRGRSDESATDREPQSRCPARDGAARAARACAPIDARRRRKGWRSSTARSRRPRSLALALAGAERLARAADIAAALSIDALRGSIHPFEARIHDAAAVRRASGRRPPTSSALMRGSGINKSHEHCGKVQDAYSLRCAAQVHGAARDALALRARDGRRSRPTAPPTTRWCSPTRGDIVSGGNFHGAPIAIAADLLGDRRSRSSRRSASGGPIGSSNPALSGLPAFLTRDGGLQSGYMMAQVTAAALASELKTLAHPAGVDTIPTSANKEDHVSMSMTRRAEGRARASQLRARRDRHRDPLRVPGDRPARAARRRRRALAARARARAIARADARRRPSAGARHRRDRAIDRVAARSKTRAADSQVKNFSFSI